MAAYERFHVPRRCGDAESSCEPLEQAGVLGKMTGPVEAAKNGVEIAKRDIFDQMRRVEQQRALIGKLERDDLHDRLPGARRLLSYMERTLAEFQCNYSAAEEQFARARADAKESSR
jgi:hypothetical protein